MRDTACLHGDTGRYRLPPAVTAGAVRCRRNTQTSDPATAITGGIQTDSPSCLTLGETNRKSDMSPEMADALDSGLWVGVSVTFAPVTFVSRLRPY